MIKLFIIVLIIICCTQDVIQVSCSLCPSGTYYSQGNCKICPGQCKTCTSKTTCNSCIDGYYLNYTSCMKCNSNCQTCTSSTTCNCLTNQYVNNNTCYDCSQGCISCSSSSSCTNCLYNYYLSNNICKLCGHFCKICSSTGCSSCLYTNMYIQGHSCLNCSNGCASCNNQRICFKCYESTSSYCVQSSLGSSSSSSLNILIIIIPTIAGSFLLIFVLVVLYRKSKRIQLIMPEASSLIQWKENQDQMFGEDCIICLQTGNSYLSCGHIFHPKCLFEWFRHEKWCPMCHSQAISKEVTVICEKCRRMRFKKTLNEVIEFKSEDTKICRDCKLIEQSEKINYETK